MSYFKHFLAILFFGWLLLPHTNFSFGITTQKPLQSQTFCLEKNGILVEVTIDDLQNKAKAVLVVDSVQTVTLEKCN